MITWNELLPTSEEEVSGTLADFLTALRMLQPGERLPPFAVIQDMLSRGLTEGGMGGGLSWNPDQVAVSPSDYATVLLALPETLRAEDTKAESILEWKAWCAEKDLGIPYAEHVAWLKRLDDLGSENDADVLKEAKVMSDYFAFVASHTSRN